MQEIMVDQEFKFLLPTLSKDTYALLEDNLLENGVRDPVVIWGGIIIDGHNRYEIATKHGLPFTTVSMEFESRDDVLIWIINTQVSRRNLTPVQLSYFRGLHYNADKRVIKNAEGHNQHNEVSVHNEHKPKNQSTAGRLGRQYNVSPMTIRRDAQVANALRAIGEASPEAKRDILSGATGISRKRLQELATQSEEEIKSLAMSIENGTFEKRKVESLGANQNQGFGNGVVLEAGEFPNLDEIDTLCEILLRVTDGFGSDLRRLAGDGSAQELRKALRAFIDVLEDLCKHL